MSHHCQPGRFQLQRHKCRIGVDDRAAEHFVAGGEDFGFDHNLRFIGWIGSIGLIGFQPATTEVYSGNRFQSAATN
jgi:hypothetical protein